MQAAELFIKCLEARGIKYIFGLPGEENLALLEAIRKSAIKFVVTRNEQAAVFMAATFGRLTGLAGVALSTLGPGATNLVTGVAYAQLGAMPLLVITGQKPIKKSKQGKFQIIDVVRMMQPITKLSQTIISAEKIPGIIAESFRISESERPGAVHIELPEDVAAEQTILTPINLQKIRRPGPDPKAVALAVRLIEQAKKPIILVGSGANRKLVRKHLKTLIAKTGIPFVTTQTGKGVEDESSPLYIGSTALSSNDFVHRALEAADVIIVLGHDITEKPPVLLTPPAHKVIHINFLPAEIDNVYIPVCEVIGDISHSLWAITENIQTRQHWNFSEFFTQRDKLKNQFTENSQNFSFPLKPEKLVSDLRKILAKDAIVSLDNGMYKIWFARNFPVYQQNTLLLDNSLAAMGAGLSAGIAAKILNPEKQVVVVAGDGGIMMNIGELETAKRLGLDLTVLILNDSTFGMIRWKQQQLRLENFGLEFTNPDFIQLAQSFGAKGYRVEKTEDFADIVEKALNSKGIGIIDCPIDYSSNFTLN